MPGSLYVYLLVYGPHPMLNLAGPQGAGAAVLIRSAGAANPKGTTTSRPVKVATTRIAVN